MIGCFFAALMGAILGGVVMLWALGKGLDFMDGPAVDPYWEDEEEYRPIDRGGREL